MISSLFGQTRPVNYVLILSALFLFFILAHIGFLDQWNDPSGFMGLFLTLGSLLFSLFIVNFIVQRNQLTSTNSFAMLFYSFFLILFPETLLDSQVVYANLFLLLALRRLISIRSMKNLRAKIFDGAFWILIASLFFNWMVLFVLLVWLYIYFYVPKQFNYWLIPLVAGAVVGLTGWSLSFALGDPEFLFHHFRFTFQSLNREIVSTGMLIKLAAFLLVTVAAGITSFIRQGKSGQGKITQLRLLVLGWLLGVLVVLLSGERLMSTVLFVFLPSAVFMARYVELIKREVLRNLAIFGLMALCMFAFFAQWVVK